MASMSLSLSPRYDLFRISFDKTFLIDEVAEKYQRLINKDTTVVTSPIDYLNESIQGFHFPGLSELLVEQQQISHHKSLGKLSFTEKQLIEPDHPNKYISASNPLTNLEDQITITFRMNIGLMNYFMIYENTLKKISKAPAIKPNDDIIIYILNDLGEAITKVVLHDCLIDSIDGIDFSYSRVERQNETFNVIFRYNNIEFHYIDLDENK